MVTCNLTYGPRGDANGTKRVTQFMPKHRSFSLLNLEQNTSYSFLMSCSDREDNLWSSEKIKFDTGVVISSVDPKLGAIFSPRRQEIESANRDIRSKYIMGQYKARDPVSPHTLMAVSCTIVGLIITGTTLGIVARRYSRADRIKIPKEVETQMLDGQIQTAEVADCTLSLGMGSMGTGSVSSAASYIDISGYVDSAPYSFTEGESEQPAVQTDLFWRKYLVQKFKIFCWNPQNIFFKRPFLKKIFLELFWRKYFVQIFKIFFSKDLFWRKYFWTFSEENFVQIFKIFFSKDLFWSKYFWTFSEENILFNSSKIFCSNVQNIFFSQKIFSEENMFGPFLKKIFCSNVQNISFKKPFLKKIFLFKSSRYFLKKIFCSKVLNVRVE